MLKKLREQAIFSWKPLINRAIEKKKLRPELKSELESILTIELIRGLDMLKFPRETVIKQRLIAYIQMSLKKAANENNVVDFTSLADKCRNGRNGNGKDRHTDEEIISSLTKEEFLLTQPDFL